MGPVFDRWHEVTFGRTIGAEFVGDDPLGWHALLLQQPEQQSPCSPGIAPALNDFIENVAVLIDGTPKPVLSAGDGARRPGAKVACDGVALRKLARISVPIAGSFHKRR